MPLEITNQTRVREPVLSTEYRGPCAMCGNNLRKLSHYGPWIPERLHQKCWKAQQNAEVREQMDMEEDAAEIFARLSIQNN